MLAVTGPCRGRERLGAEHPATVRTATGLSVSLRRLAPTRDAAVDLARDTYELARNRHGKAHPDTMAAMISLSNSLRTVGQFTEALALADEASAAYAAIYGPDHPYNYGCIGNLGLLSRVRGDTAEARGLNERALEGLDARLGREVENHLAIREDALKLAAG